ncbi:MAG: GNAT family N-acetyltransferase [Bdellovibrionales bacterium]
MEYFDDIEIIRALTQEAFQNVLFSNQTEAQIIDALRDRNALSLSLVAVENDVIIGHVCFSPVYINDVFDHWYGLGPISVHSDFRRQGVGSALIRQGLEMLNKENARGCVVLGDPQYYRRFGFSCFSNLKYEGAPAEYFLCLAFDGVLPKGVVKYDIAFDQD